MGIQIGATPGHTFEEPLGLLSDCHRRIEYFLHVIVTVATEADGGPLSPDYRSALDAALRYFSIAAPKHTADEEASLFPRLRAASDPAAAEALALLDGLEHDHDDADAHHAAVDALARDWLANDALPTARAAELRQHLADLQALYRAHIRIEDEQLFPAASRVLDRAEVREIGREMAARRGVRAGEP